MALKQIFRSRSGRILWIALALALVNGSIFVLLVPPWQHYDEPNHFEYVWLIAKRGVLPKPDDYDQSMRRAVAISMINHGFFKGLNFKPDLNPESGPIWIGAYSQLSNRPFYYTLASIPLRILPVSSVTVQLYLARLVSLALFLLTVLAAWGMTAELFPAGHPLRLLVPVTVALLPGFTDIMTSVNNDVGAISVFSLTLWGIIRLMRRGPALLPAAFTVLGVYLCYLTKETAYLALPVFVLALLFALLRGRRRRLAWAILSLGLLGGILVALTWGDASYWYRSTSQAEDTRALNSKAVAGKYVLQLKPAAEVTPSWTVPLFQPVPSVAGYGLAGKTYTFGVWMWANKPVEAVTPILNDMKQSISSPISLGTEPVFYAATITLSDDSLHRMWVSLSPLQGTADQDLTIDYDGMVLVEGARSLDQPPVFDSPGGQSGTWGGQPFTNLLRNGSAESGGLHFRPLVDQFGAKFSPDETRPSLILTYLLDWQGARLFYRAAADRLFRTFWGMFGWGHVPLVGFKPYYFLGAATLLGAAGGLWMLWRKRLALAWDAVLVLGVTLLLIWGLTFVRGALYLATANPYFPVARYALPVILPTALLLCGGWYTLLEGFGCRLSCWLARRTGGGQADRLPPALRRVDSWATILILAFLAGLDLLAVYSIFHFYRG